MKYIVDIDNTICISYNSDYKHSQPIYERIKKINQLYESGHIVIYWTARGMNSGTNWKQLTEKQLTDWNCKYHELWMNKPSYDIWIDDKADWIFE
jgi:hypothetical protein